MPPIDERAISLRRTCVQIVNEKMRSGAYLYEKDVLRELFDEAVQKKIPIGFKLTTFMRFYQQFRHFARTDNEKPAKSYNIKQNPIT